MDQPERELSNPASRRDRFSVPLHTRLMRRVLRSVVRAIFRLLMRVKCSGLKNIPSTGPYLIAINHVSLYDPPFCLAFWPTPPEAAGAADLWDKPGISALARLYGGIPVHRGQYDRKMIDTVVKALEAGRPVLIAPEGTRSHAPGMNQAMPGIVFLTDRVHVPVIPVGIVGTTDDLFDRALHFKRPTIEMRVGAPISLPPLEGRGEQRRQLRQAQVDRIMYKIAELLPPEYQGVYGKEIHARQ